MLDALYRGEVQGDIELTDVDLRVVARYAIASAAPLLPVFERDAVGDLRPRLALSAAVEFAEGAPRGVRLRQAATEAHRAAADAPTDAARLSAQAAGDAAAAAYLHPLRTAHQVGHILRAAANAAAVAELLAGGDEAAAEREIQAARGRASKELVEILRRYPPARPGSTRTGQLMSRLDGLLRAG